MQAVQVPPKQTVPALQVPHKPPQPSGPQVLPVQFAVHARHSPTTQDCSAEQVNAHLPQFASSVPSTMQVPLQHEPVSQALQAMPFESVSPHLREPQAGITHVPSGEQPCPVAQVPHRPPHPFDPQVLPVHWGTQPESGCGVCGASPATAASCDPGATQARPLAVKPGSHRQSAVPSAVDTHWPFPPQVTPVQVEAAGPFEELPPQPTRMAATATSSNETTLVESLLCVLMLVSFAAIKSAANNRKPTASPWQEQVAEQVETQDLPRQPYENIEVVAAETGFFR
jgi:hypothetical protein